MKKNLAIAALLLFTMFGFQSDASSQWVQTNGPYGGVVLSLAAIDNNIFAATEAGYNGGFLFRSTDNGSTWTPLNTPWEETKIRTLLPNGSSLFVVAPGGIYITTDYGISWTKTAGYGLPNQFALPTCLAVSGTTLFAGIGTYSFIQNDGLYRSTDNGESWIGASTGMSSKYVHALATSSSNLFAGTSSGIYRSTDNGTSWNLVDSGLSKTYIYSLVVSGDNLFAATRKRGILRSTDNGVSWKTVNTDPTDTTAYLLTASGEDLFARTSHGMFRSTDYGERWTAMDNALGSVISFAVSGSNLFAGSRSGVYLSTDKGTTWGDVTSKMITQGGSVMACGSLLFDQILGGGGTLFVSTDDGTSWYRDTSGLAYPSAIVEYGSDLLARTTYNTYLSADNGISWIKSADSGLSPATISGLTSAFAIIGSNLFISSSNRGVFRSTDIGATWTAVNNGFSEPQGIADSNSVFALATSGSDLFAATHYGGIYRSTDYGAQWSKANFSLPENDYLNTLSAIGTNLYIGVSGIHDSIFLSTNNGSSWDVINSGIPSGINVESFVESGTNIFATSGNGSVFLSTNAGISWIAVDSGLGKNKVTSIALKGSNLFAGTEHNGIWRRPLSEMVGKYAVEDHSNDLSINVHPNPASHSASITFSISDFTNAQISIHDLQGAEITPLFSGRLYGGKHSFTWNAQGLPAGIYFCKIRLNNEVKQLPLILTR